VDKLIAIILSDDCLLLTDCSSNCQPSWGTDFTLPDQSSERRDCAQSRRYQSRKNGFILCAL